MHVNTWSGVASSLLSFLLRTILGIAMLQYLYLYCRILILSGDMDNVFILFLTVLKWII